MSQPNLILVAATYDDPISASSDYEALKELKDYQLYVVSSVVLSRDATGKVDVDESGGAVGGGAILGAGAGLVVGLFAPPLLLATAVGAGLGALGGQLLRRHDEKKIGMELDEVMPPNTSAIIAIVDDAYADRVDKAFAKAVKRVSKAVDAGDVEELQKALDKGEKELGKALDS
jgi:uncharacterized membrane protein